MIRHYLLTILLVTAGFFSFSQYAQQSKYFVYLQTEPAQPFYIKINGQQLSANASGYLILPQLKDGDYKLVVGFPQEKYPQQLYNFTVDSKDKGYLIKDMGSDGWGLFDLQTMAVQKPLTATQAAAIVNTPASQPQATSREDVSDFTKVLSKAANDPGLLEKKPEPAPEQKPVVQQPVVKNPPQAKQEQPEESVSSAPQLQEKLVEKQMQAPPVAENHSTQNSGTPKQMPSRGRAGVELVYENTNDAGQPEPVTIFISEPKAQSHPEPQHQEPQQDLTTTTQESNKTFTVEEKPAIPQQVQPEQAVTGVTTSNSNCKKVADEDDFLKLRRLMSQKATDDEMISQARTAFKNKCYTTAQIKYLSSMFLSNAGKYNFYEAARPHVADTGNFSSLRAEIKDEYYLGKFDSLAGQ